MPHFNYVGDSILGHKAHLGAGVKISNIKVVKGNVNVEIDGKLFDTGLRKLGAILGDYAEVGCNAVLNPGTIIGRNSIIYPNVSWRGILPANMIAKNKASVNKKKFIRLIKNSLPNCYDFRKDSKVHSIADSGPRIADHLGAA